jgi:hypothetical protein
LKILSFTCERLGVLGFKDELKEERVEFRWGLGVGGLFWISGMEHGWRSSGTGRRTRVDVERALPVANPEFLNCSSVIVSFPHSLGYHCKSWE